MVSLVIATDAFGRIGFNSSSSLIIYSASSASASASKVSEKKAIGSVSSRMARKSSVVMLADGRRFISNRLTPRLSLAGPDDNNAGLVERLRATLPPLLAICVVGVGVRRALRGGAGGKPLLFVLMLIGLCLRPFCGCLRPSSDDDVDAEEGTLSGRDDKSCGSTETALPSPLPSPHGPMHVGLCRFRFRRLFHNSLLLVRLILPPLPPMSPALFPLFRNRSNTLLLALRSESSDALVPARLLFWPMAPVTSLTDRTNRSASLSPVSVWMGLGRDGTGASKAPSLSASVALACKCKEDEACSGP